MTEIPLSLALDGYLASPVGRVRHIFHLDTLARDALTLGARLYWKSLPGNQPGGCYVHSRRIVLAPWVFWAWPWYIRKVLSEELAHCAVGYSESRAAVWQGKNYSHLITPPVWMA